MSIQDSNQGQSLYAARIPIFPRRVKGTFRTLKWWIMGVTLAIYYLTPWIRWDRGPAMPDQAVLVDLANRRFFFFWIEIWPQQFIYVAGLLIMAGSVATIVGAGLLWPQTKLRFGRLESRWVIIGLIVGGFVVFVVGIALTE